jgi:hypothetical protein
MTEPLELNEKAYLEAMREMEWTDTMIAENRAHHGGELYLADRVALGALWNGAYWGVGTTVDHKTGELIHNETAQALIALEKEFDALVNKAYAAFGDPLANPEHGNAMREFASFLNGRAQEVWHDLGLPTTNCDDETVPF